MALPLGIVATLYRGRAADMLAMGFAVVGQATPCNRLLAAEMTLAR